MSELIQDRPVVAPDAADPAPKGRQHWFVIIAASALGGLLLGGAYLFFFSGGDSETLEPIAAAPAASAAASGAGDAGDSEAPGATDASASPSPEASAAVAQTTVKMTSRDPFTPLVAKADAADAPKASDDDAKAAEPAEKAAGATLSALKISPLGNSATLKLDGKKYEVDEGETFASSFRLYDIFNANCAGFLYGDQNAVVCEGDSVQIG